MQNNIAIITNSFSITGGAENTIENIARELKNRGKNVTIYVPEKQEVNPHHLEEFTIRRLSHGGFQVGILGMWFERKEKRSICRELQSYEVVLFSMVHSALALFPFFKHKNWIVNCRGGDIQNPRKTPYLQIVKKSPYKIKYKGLRTTWKYELFLRIFLYWARKKALFITNSTDMINELYELGISPKRTHKIVNGVDLQRFSKIQAAFSVENKDPDKTYVLCIGRNDSRKGFYFLIDAAASLKKQKIYNIRFIVKGKGFEKFLAIITEKELDNYFTIYDLNFNCDFNLKTNFPNDQKLPDVQTVALLGMADIVVIPSIIEAMPNVGLEAEASKKPLIVSDTFGCREYIMRGTAIGFKVGDGADLSEKIEFLVHDLKIGRNLEQARQTHHDSLSLKKCIDGYLQILEKKSVKEPY